MTRKLSRVASAPERLWDPAPQDRDDRESSETRSPLPHIGARQLMPRPARSNGENRKDKNVISRLHSPRTHTGERFPAAPHRLTACPAPLRLTREEPARM